MQRKVVGIGIGILAAAAVLFATMSSHWWSGNPIEALFGTDLGGEGLRIHVGLRKLQLCGPEGCETLTFRPKKVQLFDVFSLLTYYGSWIVVAVTLGSVALYAAQDSDTLAKATTTSGLVLSVLGTGAFFSVRSDGLGISWGYPLFLLGALILTPVTGYLHRRRAGFDGTSERLANLANVGAPSKPPLAPNPNLSADKVKEGIQRAVKDATAVPGAFIESRKPAAPSVAKVRDASADAAAKVLRFVARDCQLGAGTISSLTAGGAALAFTDIAEIVIAQLPPDPPFEKLTFVDLIPAAGGAPLRLLPSTRVNYAALPGGAAATSQDNFRRLCSAILAAHPGVNVDAQTLAFVKDRKPPRVFMGIEQFSAYDARF